MVSQDVGFQMKEIYRRVAVIEKWMARFDRDPITLESDWDNATLMRKWGICKRTAANYRHQGLEYFKRGGMIFYSEESREKFVKTKKG